MEPIITDRPYVFNVPVTEGGSEVETVPSIKNRAPANYAAQTRCVTSEDYDTIIREIFPAVDDIYIYGGEEMDIPQYGRVYVAIKPSTGKLSNITKKLIKDSLRQFRVASIDVKLVDPGNSVRRDEYNGILRRQTDIERQCKHRK